MKKYCLLEGVVHYLHNLVYTQDLERCSVLYEVDYRMVVFTLSMTLIKKIQV